LDDRLRQALGRINPNIPSDAIDEAVRKVSRVESPSLIENNRRFHRMLVEGVPVEFHRDGRIVNDHVRLIDFAEPASNDWLVVNQFTVIEDKRNRRADVVIFVSRTFSCGGGHDRRSQSSERPPICLVTAHVPPRRIQGYGVGLSSGRTDAA
jgi:hypothetical protein